MCARFFLSCFKKNLAWQTGKDAFQEGGQGKWDGEGEKNVDEEEKPPTILCSEN